MSQEFWSDHSLLLGLQADLTTPTTLAADQMVPVLGDTPKVTLETGTQELDLMVGQIGVAPERVVGARGGKISFSVPLQSFKQGYNPTTENPGGAPVGTVEVIPPWMILLANALGCTVESLAGATLTDKNTNFWRGTFLSNSASVTDGVASSADATHLTLDSGGGAGHKAGQLVAAQQLAGGAPFMGFIKQRVIDVLTLFDATRNPTMDAASDVLGTTTAWLSNDQPVPLTAYWTGPNTALCYVFTGLICEGGKLTLEAGQIPTIEFNYKFYDYQIDKTKGGLVQPDAFNRTPQLIGNKSGALMLGNAVKHGVEQLVVEWTTKIRETKSHYAAQGVHDVAIVQRRVKASFSLPHDVADLVYNNALDITGNTGSHYLQRSLEVGAALPLGVYVGAGYGKCFAFLMPGARVVAAPTAGDREGAVAYTVQMEAGPYAADATSGSETSNESPINSVVRVALA